MDFSYKLESFEGPLDLLLHLIEKNKVNIYDIPIVEITDQYLEYVNNMDVDTLIAVMNKYPQYVGVIRMKNLIRKNNGESGYGSDDVLRFYNRKYYCYNSPVHEQIGFRNESKINESITTFLLPMEVIHHGYFIEPEEMEKKQKRYLKLHSMMTF